MRLDIKSILLTILAINILSVSPVKAERKVTSTVIYEMSAFDDERSAYNNALYQARKDLVTNEPKLVVKMSSLSSSEIQDYSSSSLFISESIIERSIGLCEDKLNRCYTLKIESVIDELAFNNLMMTEEDRATLRTIITD